MKEIDEKLQKLGYNMPDKYFRKFAEWNGKVVKVVLVGQKLKVVNVDLDRIESDAKKSLELTELAEFVASHTTISHAPELNLR